MSLRARKKRSQWKESKATPHFTQVIQGCEAPWQCHGFFLPRHIFLATAHNDQMDSRRA